MKEVICTRSFSFASLFAENRVFLSLSVQVYKCGNLMTFKYGNVSDSNSNQIG